VGDLKTPHDEYKDLNLIYMDPEYQEKNYKKLSDLIGWNCIQRRNLGYIEAYKRGATIIASVDDDNIPNQDWGFDIFLDKKVNCKKYQNSDPNINIWDPLSVTEYKHLWHRGFPLDLVYTKNNITSSNSEIVPSVQADFWNGDPDVDAMERLIYNPTCTFSNEVFPFFGNGISPFNSQNTFFTRDSIKDFFLFPYVGRMDDIWGSYYCQAKGHKVLYNRPTVFQDRNVHNHLVDFSKELDGYLNNQKLIKNLLLNPESIQKFLPGQSWLAFLEYRKYF
jgi:hypothetical protein